MGQAETTRFGDADSKLFDCIMLTRPGSVAGLAFKARLTYAMAIGRVVDRFASPTTPQTPHEKDHPHEDCAMVVLRDDALSFLSGSVRPALFVQTTRCSRQLPHLLLLSLLICLH